MTNALYARDPVAFIDRFLPLNEKGQPWSLSRHQHRVLRAAFRWDAQGRLRLRTFLWSELKKSGKTFLAAALAIWWAFVTPNTEVICCANDLEQSVGRVFQTITKLLEQNPDLGHSAVCRATTIVLTNGTVIQAIASDYKGAAGSRHSLVIFDELWGFELERAQRLFEEMTPPPTELNAWVLIVTTAGWVGESLLLERLYQWGLSGDRIDEELELYQADELIMFWGTVPRQPWQTPQYYAEQRRHLRPNTYARLHENKWVTPESRFITPEIYDPCVDLAHRPLPPWSDRDIPIFLGFDGALKHDTAALVGVSRDKDRLQLELVKIWTPSPEQPLDLERTIEREVLDLRERHHVRAIYTDPWQLMRSIQTLSRQGVPIQEFPQTVPNQTRAGQLLYDLFVGGNIRLFAHEQLRQQVLNCVAVESPRGWRLAKEKASRKIDAAVALSLACCAAVERGRLAEVKMVKLTGW